MESSVIRQRRKRGGLRQKIRHRRFKLALPTVMYGNIRSLKNKIDELTSCTKHINEYRNACAIVLTESWLDESVPDSCVSLDNHILVRADRSAEQTGKTRGGGVCIYINNRWCTNYTVKHTLCSPHLELLVVQCRPFYLPRDICCIAFVVVYIPPSADKRKAEEDIASVITELETSKPDAGIIVLGDFNGSSLQTVLPRYKQYVNFPSREENCLDLCYCNLHQAYQAKKRPPLGRSDHSMIHLSPSYAPRLKASKPVTKSVKCWDEDKAEQLSGALACTDWTVFTAACPDLDSLTTTVTDYINFCVDLVVPEKCVKIFPNNKPWVTKELKALTHQKHVALKQGDKAAARVVQKELNRQIDVCKNNYKSKVEGYFSAGNSKSCWQGLKKISGYSKPKGEPPQGSQQEWADELNDFYARFEKPDPPPATVSQASVDTPITEDEVRKVLQSVNVSKSPGPDGISPRVLRAAASDLAPVLTSMYNLSLETCRVPLLWKTSTVVPVPKKPVPKVKNDYRPVALTPIVMKCFERLILRRLLQQVSHLMDPLQFAYKQGRSTEDATAYIIHRITEHLDSPGTYARVLYVDFSSAFNTMRPSTLHNKLRGMGVNESLCRWILDYLRGRQQKVRVGSVFSKPISTFIGAPQGCVLSPVLFTLYTNDHRGQEPHTFIGKYADDAGLVGLISGDDERPYRNSIIKFVQGCDADDLELNVAKTKEMIVDFRKGVTAHDPVVIKGSGVEIVHEYDYLGTRVASDLCWIANIKKQVAKAMKRLYHLRKLREFKVNPSILKLFYTSIIESVMLFGVAVWGGNLPKAAIKMLERVQRYGRRICGVPVTSWHKVYEEKAKQLAQKIMDDSMHPLNKYFSYLPSGRRLRQLRTRTQRYRRSFLPNSIALFNSVNY